MKGFGLTIRLKARDLIIIMKELIMKESGTTIFNKDMVLRCGLMEQSMRANITTDRKKERVNFLG